MKEPMQLNGNAEWGTTARQQHRFYSIYRGGICLQSGAPNRGVMKILELYEK